MADPEGEVGRVNERDAALAVATARGVGPATAARLLEVFGSYGRAVDAALGRAPGGGAIATKVRSALRASAAPGSIGGQRETADGLGARFAVPGDPDYPAVLSEIPRAPVGLFVRGSPLESLEPMVAVVGTRSPTPRGAAVAFELAAEMARRGIAVSSGLARGIDTEAHGGALDVGGTTVAVLGSGLDRVYPPENAELADRVAGRGAVVSEFAMGQQAKPGLFPQRNRIIAGLSVGVVVVEAAERSGALITSARALEQGREVFAVPGPIDEPQSRGPNGLIKAGAKLVEDVGDILDELEGAWGPFGDGAATAPGWAPADGQPPTGAGRLTEAVADALSLTPVTADDIATRIGAPVPEVLAALLELELGGRVDSCPGGRYIRGRRRGAAAEKKP